MTRTTTRNTARTGFRYICIDWGDDTVGCPPCWCLLIDGNLVATAKVGNPARPPHAVTEGLVFTRQYHSAAAAKACEPDSWVYRPTRRPWLPPAAPFYAALAAAAVTACMSLAWKPAIAASVALTAAAVAVEVRKAPPRR